MEDIFFNMSAMEWAETLRNYALAGSGLFASWVAWQGVKTWKIQQTWKDDRELATAILTVVYRLEKSIRGSRDDMNRDIFFVTYGDEVQHSPNHEMMPDRDVAYYRHVSDTFRALASELDPLLLQARALWGDKVPSAVGKLVTQYEEQISSMFRFVNLQQRAKRYPDSRKDEAFYKKLHSREDAMFRQSDGDDAYDLRTDSIIEEIEDVLETHLGRPS